MRHFIWPILLLAIGGPEVNRAVMRYLEQNYPLKNAEYICDTSRLDLSRVPPSDSVAIDGFGKDNPRGQTVVRMSFYKNGDRVYQTAAGVRIGILKPALVSKAPVKAGEPIAEYDIETVDIASFDEAPLESPEDLQGLVACHFIPAGRVLVPSAVKAPPTLRSGDPVRICYTRGTLRLDARGVARENGSRGSRVKVMNSDSRKIISAVVVDSATVAIGGKAF